MTRMAGKRQEYVEEFVFWHACMVEKVRRSGGAETLRSHIRHRIRLLAENHTAGTYPYKVPARWVHTCLHGCHGLPAPTQVSQYRADFGWSSKLHLHGLGVRGAAGARRVAPKS